MDAAAPWDDTQWQVNVINVNVITWERTAINNHEQYTYNKYTTVNHDVSSQREEGMFPRRGEGNSSIIN